MPQLTADEMSKVIDGAIATGREVERERCAKIAEEEKEICESQGERGDSTAKLIMSGQIGAASRIAAAIRRQ